MTERERFLRDYYQFIRVYEKSPDPVIAYGIALSLPILEEIEAKAIREQKTEPRLVKK